MGQPVSMPVLSNPPRVAGLPQYADSRASGGRDLWSAPLESPPTEPLAAVWQLLGQVLDPEIPISVVDLGLIYDIEYEGGQVRIALTFTATGCPCMDFIREDITDRLLSESWIDGVSLLEVWDPPWTNARISPAGRVRLRQLGIGA